MRGWKLSRRDLLIQGGAIATLGGMAPPAAAKTAAEPVCFNPKIGDRSLAKALHYVEEAKDQRKICDVCMYFTEQSAPCGPCMLMRGPVNPAGTCDAWAEAK